MPTLSHTHAHPHKPGLSTSVDEVLESQIIRIKRGRMNQFGFEPAWNAYFDYYLSTKYFAKPLLELEDVTFHLFLRKNLNDNDPDWKMPSIPFLKRQFGMGQTKIDKMIARLAKAQLLTKVSGKRKGSKAANVANEYVLSDPIPSVEDFLLVANAGIFGQPLREEWQEYINRIHTVPEEETPPLPKMGKAPLPEMGKAPLPKMGKHKHTSHKHTSDKQTLTTVALEESAEPAIPPNKNDVVVALVSIGMTEKVAQKLATHHSREHILEKIEYLEFVKQKQPEKVKNPCGWLRKAIEENYSQPDGFKSQEELKSEVAAQQKAAEESIESWKKVEAEQALKLNHRREQERLQLEALKQQYGTSETEIKIWQTVLDELKEQTSSATYQGFLAKTVLLSTVNGQILIGVSNAFGKEWLERQMTNKIKRALKAHQLDVKLVNFVAITDQLNDAKSAILHGSDILITSNVTALNGH